jgi:hypothetical protein
VRTWNQLIDPCGPSRGLGFSAISDSATRFWIGLPIVRSWRTDFLLRAAKATARLSMRTVCPMCARYIMTMIRMHIMHRESPATRAVLRQAQPSQREGQLDDVDYQTAYQSARTVGVNGIGVQSPPQGRSTTQTVDGVEQGRQGPVDDYTSPASPRDSAISFRQSETATSANGWLTKMIKARLHLKQSGPD